MVPHIKKTAPSDLGNEKWTASKLAGGLAITPISPVSCNLTTVSSGTAVISNSAVTGLRGCLTLSTTNHFVAEMSKSKHPSEELATITLEAAIASVKTHKLIRFEYVDVSKGQKHTALRSATS